MSSYYLSTSTSLLLPSKLAFHYCPASKIVPHIMQVNSSDFLYNYFICNMSMKEQRQPYQYSNFKYSQLITKSISDNFVIVCLIICTRQTIEFSLTKSCQTIGNSAEFCGNFGNNYFIHNLSIIVEISQSIHTIQTQSIETESISENFNVICLIGWTRPTIEFNVSHPGKHWKHRQNSRIWNTLHVLERTH